MIWNEFIIILNKKHMENDKIIVVSHYSNRLDWLKNINEKYIIYSKVGNIDFDHIRIYTNRGFDTEIILKFIVDNYDNLPTKMMFVHDHDFSYHQDYTLTHIINNINWDLYDYFSINKNSYYSEISKNHYSFEYDIICKNWEIFENKLELPEKFFYRAGAQFVVDKKLILQYDKIFYEKLLNWILHQTKLPDAYSSRIFEWTWHYFFTGECIDKHNYNFLK